MSISCLLKIAYCNKYLLHLPQYVYCINCNRKIFHCQFYELKFFNYLTNQIIPCIIKIENEKPQEMRLQKIVLKNDTRSVQANVSFFIVAYLL